MGSVVKSVKKVVKKVAKPLLAARNPAALVAYEAGKHVISPKMPNVKVPSLAQIGIEDEKERKKKLRRGLSKTPTILTSPLGLTGSAPTKKPTLLGG